MAADEDDLKDDEAGDGKPEPKLGGGRSKIVTILLWVAGAVVAVLMTVLISYLVAKKVKTEAFKEEQNIVIAPAPLPLSNYHFPDEFRVNTADTAESHYIQVSITLAYEGENKNLETELNARQSQMKHIINIILGGKTMDQLVTPLQKINLAEEIKSQINMILRDGKIVDVYFDQIVIS